MSRGSKEKVKQNLQSFEDLMMRYNPFGYKQSDGKVCMFNTYYDAYLYTMEQLFIKFPRGYIDMVVFLNDMTQMPYLECSEIVVGQFGKELSDPVLLPEGWDVNSAALSFTMMKIIKKLHTITETEYSPTEFQQALAKFYENMKNDNVSGKLPRFK